MSGHSKNNQSSASKLNSFSIQFKSSAKSINKVGEGKSFFQGSSEWQSLLFSPHGCNMIKICINYMCIIISLACQ
ncbi:hypothetical protein BpHYR1_038475 [Brachionus plicatilis]|uniref:Uncharacterized protein n=1 Tax=Brachionus plicatilis TaxID=10195 RepID=A0A3M7RMX4_BRAPC|nr:hypothetical protein BpHYR1_038475 [Brachionus plicatilis]